MKPPDSSSPAPRLWYAFDQGRFDGVEPWFFREEDFPFLQELETRWREIHAEIRILLAEDSQRLKPYLHQKMSFPPGDWKTLAFYFWKLRVRENCRQCPQLDAFLQTIPGLTAAALSVLEPQTKINPHHGDTNAIARIHLGLEIPGEPPDCAFQVGEEIRAWHPGQAHVFCDAHFHMAWNFTDRRRLILILDVMRPDFQARTNVICGRVLGSLLMLSMQEAWPALAKLPMALRRVLWRGAGLVMQGFIPLQRRFSR